MSKIDDVINSVVRQCSFDRFEELAHTARDKGELSSEELDAFWAQAMVEYYGKAGSEGGDSPFDTYEDTSHLWSYGKFGKTFAFAQQVQDSNVPQLADSVSSPFPSRALLRLQLCVC